MTGAGASSGTGSAVRNTATLAVVVAALGYLVDIYDLILFGAVRVASLTTLGVPADQIGDVGLGLMNWQMAGMLAGGILWGVLGDKRGRLYVLFGSIFMYSVANVANGFVDRFPGEQAIQIYAVMRFVAGVGLAGELGAGITLVSELVDKERRGYATTIVAGIGILGALLAVTVSRISSWQIAYWIGGGLGFALLFLRVGVVESGIFLEVKETASVSRGNFFALFATRKRALRYLCTVATGAPIWFVIGILVLQAREFGAAMGLDPAPAPPTAIFWGYFGLAIGDFGSGVLSQVLKSRRRAIAASILLNVVAIGVYFWVGRTSLTAFYASCVLLGVANGYWSVFVTVAAEQFGTNLRATATTTAPNFVRGSLVPITILFTTVRDAGAGPIHAAMIVGAITIALGLAALMGIDETYGKDLDFVET